MNPGISRVFSLKILTKRNIVDAPAKESNETRFSGDNRVRNKSNAYLERF